MEGRVGWQGKRDYDDTRTSGYDSQLFRTTDFSRNLPHKYGAALLGPAPLRSWDAV